MKELSDKTRVPQQAFIREAISDLLVKHGVGNNGWYADIVIALKQGKEIARRYASMSNEAVWTAKSEEYRKNADNILAVLGRK